MGSIETLDHPGKVVNTSLNYYLAPEDGGVSSYVTGSVASYRRKFQEHPAQIHDIRGLERDFMLEKQGFQLYHHQTDLDLFSDDENIKRHIYPEVEKLLKQVTGASRVYVISHLKRCDNPEATEKLVEDTSLRDAEQTHKVIPARFAHIDQSDRGALTTFVDNVPPEDIDRLLKSRWSITNVWRPLKPVQKDPLAMCDSRTVDEADLFPVTAVLPPKGSTTGGYDQVSKRSGFELLQVRQNSRQTWYYASDMTPEEVLLIKIFDTKKDGSVARRTPHCAFIDPDLQQNRTRESIEIRCFTFWEDQPA
ncbi:MAG: hypothetical protein Q9227_002036 [Pyrenula ochraceoflavens]